LSSGRENLQPPELKILRGLWKIFGAKVLDTISGPVPVDWDAAAQLATMVITAHRPKP
jgi:hypothetical protein